MNSTKIFTFIIAILIGLWVYVDPFSSEVTAYPLACENENATYSTCEHKIPLNKSVYTINKKEDSVTSSMPGVSVPIQKYKDCAILNVHNWTCKYEDSSGMFGFADGKYFSYFQTNTEIEGDIIYVTRLQYFLTRNF